MLPCDDGRWDRSLRRREELETKLSVPDQATGRNPGLRTTHSRDHGRVVYQRHWVTQVSEIVRFVQEYFVATVDIIHSSWGNH